MNNTSARALGTNINIQAKNSELVLAEVVRLEKILSRFDNTALTQLNQKGILENPPPELHDALLHALQIANLSNGLITPTVLPALERIGYSTSWQAGEIFLASDAPARPGQNWQNVRISPARIELKHGTRIDLGGTGKTWIAERVAEKIDDDFILDFGGDIFARQSINFVIAVDNLQSETCGIELEAGTYGVCTSSTQRRSWGKHHHLIDPRTGESLTSNFVQVTAVSALASTAEVISKLAFFGLHELKDFSEQTELLFTTSTTGETKEWTSQEINSSILGDQFKNRNEGFTWSANM